MNARQAIDRRAVGLLLDGDQAGLSRLATRLSDHLALRVACPECDDPGPHESSESEDEELLCRTCGYVFSRPTLDI